MKEQKEENVFFSLVSDGDNWMNAFRQNIGILRTYYGWTVRALAEKANISRSLLSNIEAPNMAYSFSLEVFYNLADALDISPQHLISASVFPDEIINKK